MIAYDFGPVFLHLLGLFGFNTSCGTLIINRISTIPNKKGISQYDISNSRKKKVFSLSTKFHFFALNHHLRGLPSRPTLELTNRGGLRGRCALWGLDIDGIGVSQLMILWFQEIGPTGPTWNGPRKNPGVSNSSICNLRGPVMGCDWWYCWWQPEIRLYNRLRLVVEIPLFTRFLYIPGGCLGFLPSTVVRWDGINLKQWRNG